MDMGNATSSNFDQTRRLGQWWVLTAITATAIVAPLAVFYADSSYVGAVGIVAFILIAAWLLYPKKAEHTPKLLVLITMGFVFSSILPDFASLGLQFLVVAVSMVVWIRTSSVERRGKSTVIFALIILVLWTVFILNPNVPNFSTGLLGFRKTAFCVAGIIAGCAIPRGLIRSVEFTVVCVLIGAIGFSVLAHLYIPSIVGLVDRSADEYTSLYNGEARLEGIFAGPFHAALGSLLLLGWGLVRINQWRLPAIVALATGTVALYLTMVRSAYVAIIIMLLILIVVAPNFSKFIRRFAIGIFLFVAVGTVLIVTVPSVTTTALSVFDFASDGRVLNRLPEYSHGLEMFRESPIIGMGSGSAGDTLGPAFVSGEHVTPHNMLLKIMVEGGLIGLLAWAGLAWSIVHRTRWLSTGGRLSLVSFSALISLGLTGSAIDTLPLSFIVFFFAGLAIDTKTPNNLFDAGLIRAVPKPSDVK